MKLKDTKQGQARQKLSADGKNVDSTTAFYLGYNASVIGLHKMQNPFSHDSEAYEWWRRGWECKYFGEDPAKSRPKDEQEEQPEPLTLGVR